jgi:hypothetical protein
MGHIPGFTNNIFPPASLPYLNLTSTIALVLFLFLVGLEIDMGTMTKNLRRSGLISLAGMILPFGLGAAVAVPIYHNFVNHELVTFGHFLLFTCVAMSITAFPGEARSHVWFKFFQSRAFPFRVSLVIRLVPNQPVVIVDRFRSFNSRATSVDFRFHAHDCMRKSCISALDMGYEDPCHSRTRLDPRFRKFWAISRSRLGPKFRKFRAETASKQLN